MGVGISMTTTHPIVDISGVKLELDPELDPSVRDAMSSGRYEQQELYALAHSLCPDDTVMELGTGIGLVSAHCAKRIGSDRVFTFEANPQLEPHIRNTYRLNGVCPNLEICMLTDRHGERDFFVHKAFWASSADQCEGALRVRIPTKPVNEQIHRIDPTVLVMDIEGGEHALIPIIDFHHISRVVIEIHERKLGREKTDALVRCFYDAGFAINRALSSWEICCFERPARTDGTHVSLDEFLHGTWRLASHWTAPCLETMASILPVDSRYALVDDDQWGSLQVFSDRTRVPFMEKDGEYWGNPVDDAAAIAELDRLHGKGLGYILFASNCFWWLDYYKGFAQHLNTRHRCVFKNERLIAFELTR